MIKIFSFLLPIVFVLGQYNFTTGVTYADIYLILYFFLYIIHANLHKLSLRSYDKFLIFFIFILICSFFIRFFVGIDLVIFDSISRSVRLIFYLVMGIFIIPRFINISVMLKYYKVFIFISTLFLVLQAAIFYILGYYIDGVLVNLNFSNPAFNPGPIILGGKYLRAPSFFFEPGYYAQLVLPMITILTFTPKLVIKNNKDRIFLLIFICIGLILSTSGQGIFITAIIFVFALLRNIFSMKIKIYYILIVVIVFLLFALFIVETSYFINFISRYKFTNTSSTASRVFRGIYIYFALPLDAQIFGVGYGNLGNYILSNNISTPYDIFSNYEYVSSISNIFISTGIIGGLIFLLIFYSKFRNTKYIFTKYLIIIFFILLNVSSIIVSTNSILYLVLIFYPFIPYNISNNKFTNKKKVINYGL